jgi:hypothetical protein
VLINGELIVGELALRLEVGGVDEDLAVDEAVEAGRKICGNDYLLPDVRRTDDGDQAGFFSQLPAQRGQPVRAWFYAAAWSSPDGRRSVRDRRVGEDESAEQDVVVLVEDDRADGGFKGSATWQNPDPVRATAMIDAGLR